MIQLDIKTRLSLKKKVDSSGCWLWKGETNREGYGIITFKGRKQLVHRVSAFVFHHYPEDAYARKRLQVNHLCKNRACWNPSHLYIGTHTQNMEDVKATPKGQKVPFPSRRRKRPPCRNT